MAPIRIAQVFGVMNRGGAENMIMNYYRHIDRQQIQFDFIVHTECKGDFDDEINALGGRIYRVPKYRGINHFSYVESWTRLLKEHEEWQIIHAHVRSTAAIFLSIARKLGRQTIAHSHSTSNDRNFGSISKSILQYFIRYESDYFLACSMDAGVWLFGDRIVNSAKFKVLPNAIEADKFVYNVDIRQKMRKSLNVDGKFVIGHVGNYTYPKNFPFLLDVLEAIIQIKDNTLLLQVGNGADNEELRSQITQRGLSNHVLLTGVRNDVNDLMQAMDVFLFPSHFEGLPVTLVEAQASGLPCVVSDVISKEIILTNLIEMLSLEYPSNTWADKLIECSQKERTNRLQDIMKKSYDIKQNAPQLVDYYVQIYNDNH